MNDSISDIFGYKPDENDDYYRILGCDELSSIEQITAEYKARVLLCHPDKHPGDTVKAAEFERIQTAKDVLCDDEKRAHYDRWRLAGISMPFKQWCNLRGAVHTSMHWTTPKKETMLEHTVDPEDTSPTEQFSSTETYSRAPLTKSFSIPSPPSHNQTGFMYATRVPWEREQPSEMLRKFRNYEI